MKRIEDASILKIYINSTDMFKNTFLYQAIVFAAKRKGMAGATVHRGAMGYGSNNKNNVQSVLEVTEKVPIIIEIVDETRKIEHFVETVEPWIDQLPVGCLITIEKARIYLKKKGNVTFDDPSI